MARTRGGWARAAVGLCAVVVALVTASRADEYASAVERAVANSRGLQAFGAADRLLTRVRESLCAANENTCENEYESTRKDLWLTLGREVLCGVGTDADSTWETIRRTNTQGAFAVLLSKCVRPWSGDLEASVLDLSLRFIARASLQRDDVNSVIVANDLKSGLTTTANSDFDVNHPSYIPGLAPVPTEITGFSETRPVVVTATEQPNETEYDDPDVARTIAEVRKAWSTAPKSSAGATEAFPSEYAKRVEKEREGHLAKLGVQSEYREKYLKHPYVKAHYDRATKCAGAAEDDDLCLKRVVPRIGYTHAEDGTRLLSVYGTPLPSDYIDFNQPYTYGEYSRPF